MPKKIISFKTKTEVLSKDKFKCQKCGFLGRSEELEVHSIKTEGKSAEDNNIDLVTLCSICSYFAPDNEKDFENYFSEKINGNILDTFRKPAKSISTRTKKGMSDKFESGQVVVRAPFGYKIENKALIPAENSYLVQEIFQDLLNQNISLTKLAKKYGLSVNGLKKVLTNQTYIGKIKFDKQTHQGSHQALISSTLFNHVQNKLESLGINQKNS